MSKHGRAATGSLPFLLMQQSNLQRQLDTLASDNISLKHDKKRDKKRAKMAKASRKRNR